MQQVAVYQWRLVVKISGAAAPENFFAAWRDPAEATVLSHRRSHACSFLYAHAHNSQTPRRWNREAHSCIQRFFSQSGE